MIRVLTAVLFLLLPFTASSEEVAAGISRDKIEINSSFKGTEVAIFATSIECITAKTNGRDFQSHIGVH